MISPCWGGSFCCVADTLYNTLLFFFQQEPKKIAVKQTYQLAEAIMSGKDVDTRKEYEAQKASLTLIISGFVLVIKR